MGIGVGTMLMEIAIGRLNRCGVHGTNVVGTTPVGNGMMGGHNASLGTMQVGTRSGTGVCGTTMLVVRIGSMAMGGTANRPGESSGLDGTTTSALRNGRMTMCAAAKKMMDGYNASRGTMQVGT